MLQATIFDKLKHSKHMVGDSFKSTFPKHQTHGYIEPDQVHYKNINDLYSLINNFILSLNFPTNEILIK